MVHMTTLNLAMPSLPPSCAAHGVASLGIPGLELARRGVGLFGCWAKATTDAGVLVHREDLSITHFLKFPWKSGNKCVLLSFLF